MTYLQLTLQFDITSPVCMYTFIKLKRPLNQTYVAHQISLLAVLLSTVINSEGEQTTSEDQSTRDGTTQDHNLTFQ